MSPARWRLIEEIYHSAVERAVGVRVAFLDEACGADTELRREVQSLLQHGDSPETLVDRPVWEVAGELLNTRTKDWTGQVISHYKILEKLGAGGMGDVYRAHDTKLGRDVAIKVVPDAFAQDAGRMGRFAGESQILASLNHPNIAAIYGVEENALVLELVEGPTLAERITTGPMPVEEALPIAKQIAEAMEYAHERGVIHRDLKPANIKLTPEGRVKVLDFGLAKLTERQEGVTASTQTMAIAGTPGYLAPEQLQGKAADARSDIFAFGCVLYELLSGRRAFPGTTLAASLAATAMAEPKAIEGAPKELQVLVRRSLRKDPARRIQHMGDVRAALVHQELQAAGPVRLSRNAWIVVGAAVVLAGVIAGWLWRASSRQRWALETAAPEIARLVDVGEYVKAAALTREARSVLPKDPTLQKLWMRSTGEVSIASVPSGADVSIRPYRGDPNAWETLGKTPLQELRVPLNAYVWRLVKPGFADSFTIDEPAGVPPPGFRSSFDLTLKLRPEGNVPHEMVVVAGGMIGLSYPLGQAPAAEIDDFVIDRHEVTNEEYKKFVDAGGYQKREFWKQPFVRDGRTVPWEDAVALFHDATGRPGPATWEVGDYPKGRERYPVAGVSWYEAAAYVEFAGKSLPTAYHWMRASQAAEYTPLITSGSNFRGEGTRPVGSEGALSGFGTTDMAGNVKEWCLNEARDAKRLMLGGGFGEPDYMFNFTDAQSPWDRLANFGFRGVKLDSPPTSAAAARVEVTTRDFWSEKPVSNGVFKAYTALYAYDKGELNAHVEETVAMEGWLRTKVTFDAAYGHERVTAHLFLPKNASQPYQTVVYFPGAFAFLDDKLDLSSVEEGRGFLLKSGRALILPIYKGMYERRDGFVPGRNPPAFFRDHVIAWAKDLGRSLDYLETRTDIDGTKLAYFGDSIGGIEGALLLAVEKRIKAAILSSGGFQLRHDLPEVDPFNFVPHVTTPVLMLNGRYDDTFPLGSSQRPLFHFLGTPGNDKKHVVYESGHGAFPRPDAVRESLDWLDKYLGPVRH